MLVSCVAAGILMVLVLVAVFVPRVYMNRRLAANIGMWAVLLGLLPMYIFAQDRANWQTAPQTRLEVCESVPSNGRYASTTHTNCHPIVLYKSVRATEVPHWYLEFKR